MKVILFIKQMVTNKSNLLHWKLTEIRYFPIKDVEKITESDV